MDLGEGELHRPSERQSDASGSTRKHPVFLRGVFVLLSDYGERSSLWGNERPGYYAELRKTKTGYAGKPRYKIPQQHPIFPKRPRATSPDSKAGGFVRVFDQNLYQRR